MYDAQRTNGATLPFWYRDVATSTPTGHAWPDAQIDVIVIGAGITGLSTAYHLLRAGRSVLVLDKGQIGSGETGRTTAHLATGLDDHYTELARIHGHRGARLAAESHAAAIDSIAEVVAREGIACDFSRVDGYLFAGSPRDHRLLEQELEAARRVGLDVAACDAAPLPFASGPAVRFANQAQLQPLAYLEGLARAVRAAGGLIRTGVRVERVEEGTPVRVHVDGGAVATAGALVVATNSPIVDVFAMHTKQAAYRSYVIALPIPKGSVARALYWDTLDPYHYLRLAGDDDVLILGGEDHKVGQSDAPEEAWTRLERWARDRFPGAGAVAQRWSGQVWEPADGLAFIGRNPGTAKNVFICTGDSGNGMTHGTIAGLLLTDLICERTNPWRDLYDPSRKIVQPRAAREFVRENLNVAMAYGDWLKPAQKRVAEIEPGHGAVVRRGAHRVALYVDERGVEHACSAVCPHLGGLVSWNRAERSWDCPCHGSRFDPYGRVLTGPAKRDLANRDEGERPSEPVPPPSAE
ncbi:MAG: FAD-dependent oxidoreductase [Polyangiales bacterium]